jgi:hypothetical protein
MIQTEPAAWVSRANVLTQRCKWDSDDNEIIIRLICIPFVLKKFKRLKKQK